MKHQRLRQFAVLDPSVGSKVERACEQATTARRQAVGEMDSYPSAASRAARVRERSVRHMDALVRLFTTEAEEGGMQVVVARDAREARAAVMKLLHIAKGSRVAKAKSMVAEETGLVEALEAVHASVVETDLGEFVVQRRSERPAHIIAPAIHLSRRDFAEVVRELGYDGDDEPAHITAFVRRHLREFFTEADAGIIGANILVASRGTVVTVTNEGNGRMCSQLPERLVAVTGIEKVVEDWVDCASVLRVLARNATGQVATSYVSLLRGPIVDKGSDSPGPRDTGIVLVDNGRSSMLGDPVFEDALRCIRCGACMNVCPVYRLIGGHAYGDTYPGPMGILWQAGLGISKRAETPLEYACTLCGECARVCPVQIDIPRSIVQLRTRKRKGFWEKFAWWLAAMAMGGPIRSKTMRSSTGHLARFFPKAFVWGARRAGWTTRAPLPVPGGGLLEGTERAPDTSLGGGMRDVPSHAAMVTTGGDNHADGASAPTGPGEFAAFGRKAAAAGTEVFMTCDFSSVVREAIERTGADLVWCDSACEALVRKAGGDVEVVTGEDRTTVDRVVHHRGRVLGVTACQALVAETGSVCLWHGPHAFNRLSSLLPDVHLVLAELGQVVATLEDALRSFDESGANSGVMITGPSRTADIEKRLVTGVHGPSQLIVAVKGEDTGNCTQ